MSQEIQIPLQAKTKKGNDIKKLPAYYPAIDEYEKAFKRDYAKNLKENFFDKLKGILK